MSFDNMGWGLQMMVLGMGIVFSLLALLWALLVVVLRFDRAETPAGASAPPRNDVGADVAADAAAGPASTPRVPSIDGIDADLLAAILVATLTHKSVRRGQAAPMMRSYWPGSLLYASRWVASGRARQTRSWQRKGG